MIRWFDLNKDRAPNWTSGYEKALECYWVNFGGAAPACKNPCTELYYNFISSLLSPCYQYFSSFSYFSSFFSIFSLLASSSFSASTSFFSIFYFPTFSSLSSFCFSSFSSFVLFSSYFGISYFIDNFSYFTYNLLIVVSKSSLSLINFLFCSSICRT